MAIPQPGATSGSVAAFPKRDGERRGLLNRTSDYKFWVLAALLLLAFWSMLTGTVTLKRSAGGLVPGDSLDLASYDDLDILEIEAREKVVAHLWDVYTHSKTVRLPRFWQNAFRAGYESLASVVPGIRDAAITQIAKMSLWSSVSNDPYAAWNLWLLAVVKLFDFDPIDNVEDKRLRNLLKPLSFSSVLPPAPSPRNP